MRESVIERLDRHALVLAIWLALGFVSLILFRTGVKLYIERRRNREGSRIE